jgi:copper ion binding protein
MTTTTLKITGMTCGHCVAAVTKALRATDGVSSADVDLEAGRARVEYDETRTSPRALASVVTDEGYTAEEGS